MPKQKLDQETQVAQSDVFDDTFEPGSDLEALSTNLRRDLNGARSMLKRLIHGLDPGNWFDDPVTIFGVDVSLKALMGSGLAFDVDDILVLKDSTIVVNKDGNVLRRK